MIHLLNTVLNAMKQSPVNKFTKEQKWIEDAQLKAQEALDGC